MGMRKMNFLAGLSCAIALAVGTTSPALAAPKGEPACALARLTAEQRDTLGTQILAGANDDNYKLPYEPIQQLRVHNDACRTENGWSEKQWDAAFKFSLTVAMTANALKIMNYSRADEDKMDDFLESHHLTAKSFAKLDDAQSTAVEEAINSNGWAHEKTEAGMQSALEALSYVASINDMGRAYMAAP